MLVLDFNLDFVADLDSFQSFGLIVGNEFSVSGNHIFLWNSSGVLHVIDTVNFDEVASIALQANVGNSANFGNIEASTDGTTLVLDAGNSFEIIDLASDCLLYTSPSPRDRG